jgi:hypothetical protein
MSGEKNQYLERRRDRRVIRLEDFTEEEIALIAKAEVPREYAYLDAELTDWQA